MILKISTSLLLYIFFQQDAKISDHIGGAKEDVIVVIRMMFVSVVGRHVMMNVTVVIDHHILKAIKSLILYVIKHKYHIAIQSILF